MTDPESGQSISNMGKLYAMVLVAGSSLVDQAEPRIQNPSGELHQIFTGIKLRW